MSRTRATKVKSQEYTAADREARKSIEQDKKDCIEELASQAKNAVGQWNQ
jgi:hypothetical protein